VVKSNIDMLNMDCVMLEKGIGGEGNGGDVRR
jgi:hypothetical protein